MAHNVSCGSLGVSSSKWTIIEGGRSISSEEIEEQNRKIIDLQGIARGLCQNFETLDGAKYKDGTLNYLFSRAEEIECFSWKVFRLASGNHRLEIEISLCNWSRHRIALKRTCYRVLEKAAWIKRVKQEALLTRYEKAIEIYRKNRSEKNLALAKSLESKVNVKVKCQWAVLKAYSNRLNFSSFDLDELCRDEVFVGKRLDALNGRFREVLYLGLSRPDIPGGECSDFSRRQKELELAVRSDRVADSGPSGLPIEESDCLPSHCEEIVEEGKKGGKPILSEFLEVLFELSL